MSLFPCSFLLTKSFGKVCGATVEETETIIVRDPKGR